MPCSWQYPQRVYRISNFHLSSKNGLYLRKLKPLKYWLLKWLNIKNSKNAGSSCNRHTKTKRYRPYIAWILKTIYHNGGRTLTYYSPFYQQQFLSAICRHIPFHHLNNPYKSQTAVIKLSKYNEIQLMILSLKPAWLWCIEAVMHRSNSHSSGQLNIRIIAWLIPWAAV